MAAKSNDEKKIGPYTLVEKIGEGGQGAVWRGFRGEGGEAVAVKVLRLSHPKKRARFVQEINIHSALSAISAPNVMPLLDHNLNETAGNGVKGYLVMPLAAVSMQDVIETLRERLELCLELLCGVATGLKAAHAAGVVHRDLKPGNILFLNRSLREPLISDFGICLLRETPEQDRITEVGETVGAKYFMAPEQQHGGVSDVTFAADVYAAGKLLHFMLTGRYLLRERLDTAFQPGELQREPRLQVVLDDMLRGTIVEDPAERLQNGAELLETCQRLLTTFRNPSGSSGGNGGSVRKYYDSFTQVFVGDPRQGALQFDELQSSARQAWEDLLPQIQTNGDNSASAAEQYVRSQPASLAATLALARLNAANLFPNFKRFLQFLTELSEGVAGYPTVATIPQVEAGFLYMSCNMFALHHESWDLLEKLLTAKFEWVYQSSRTHRSYGFSHRYFFHTYALEREASRHHDLYRSLLAEPQVVEITRLDKEQLLDVYAQTDLLMSLRAAQVEHQGEHGVRWADFARFYEERVTPLLERMYYDEEYGSGVLRSFGETRDEFFERLNERLRYIRQRFFGGARFMYSSIDEWHAR